MAHDVFVSYPNVDKSVADAVVASLEGRGVRCWVAPRDVPPGVDWAGAIIEAISRSRLMVLVFSDAANSSEHILREVREAADAGIAIMPFRTTESEPSPALKYYIGGTHWLDALSDSLESHLEELGNRVAELLAAPVAEGESSVARPSSVRPTRPVLAVSPVVAKAFGGVAVAAVLGALGLWMFGSGGDEVAGGDGVAAATTAPVEVTTVPSGSQTGPTQSPATEPTNAPATTQEPLPGVIGTSVDFVPIGIEMTPSVLAIANSAGSARICLADGSGGLACEKVQVDGVGFTDVVIADLDKDQRVDVAFSTLALGSGEYRPAANIWCRSSGQVWECSEFPGEAYQSQAVAAADLDRDGRLDVVFGGDATTLPLEEFGRAQVCWARVVIGFECESVPVTVVDGGEQGDDPGSIRSVSDIVIGSFFFNPDRDEQMEIVLMAGYERVEVCSPIQREVKNCFARLSEEGVFAAAASGDFNNDGTEDYVVGGEGGLTTVCFQGNPGGPGTYECYSPSISTGDISSVSVGDVDGDGNLDAAFGILDSSIPALICSGDGAGALSCRDLTEVPTGSVEDLQLVDFNGDGALDLLVLTDGLLQACLGTGDGSFACEQVGADALLADEVPSESWSPVGIAWVNLP